MMVHARVTRDVAKLAAAQILEENVAVANGRDEEILVAVIVDIRERRRDMDASGQGGARGFRDFLEFTASQVSPELIGSKLIHEIQVNPPVVVDISGRHTGAVVIVRGLPPFKRVLDAVVEKGDLALVHAVGKS